MMQELPDTLLDRDQWTYNKIVVLLSQINQKIYSPKGRYEETDMSLPEFKKDK